jgi:hypothetical protein
MGASTSVIEANKTEQLKRKNSLNIWTEEEKKEIEEGQAVLRKGHMNIIGIVHN